MCIFLQYKNLFQQDINTVLLDDSAVLHPFSHNHLLQTFLEQH